MRSGVSNRNLIVNPACSGARTPSSFTSGSYPYQVKQTKVLQTLQQHHFQKDSVSSKLNKSFLNASNANISHSNINQTAHNFQQKDLGGVLHQTYNSHGHTSTSHVDGSPGTIVQTQHIIHHTVQYYPVPIEVPSNNTPEDKKDEQNTNAFHFQQTQYYENKINLMLSKVYNPMTNYLKIDFQNNLLQAKQQQLDQYSLELERLKSQQVQQPNDNSFETKQLREQITLANQQLEDRDQQIAQLKNWSQHLDRSNSQGDQSLQSFSTQAGLLQQTQQAYMEKDRDFQRLQQEFQQLQAAMSQLRNDNQNQSNQQMQTQDLQRQITNLIAENNDLKSLISQLRSSSQPVQQDTSQVLALIDKVTQENTSLKQLLKQRDYELAQVRTNQTTSSTNEYQTLKSDFDRLTTSYSQSQSYSRNQQFQSEQEINSLKIRIQSLEASLGDQEHLEEQMRSLRNEIDEWKQKFNQVNRHYYHCQEKLSNAQHELDLMRAQNSNLQVHQQNLINSRNKSESYSQIEINHEHHSHRISYGDTTHATTHATTNGTKLRQTGQGQGEYNVSQAGQSQWKKK